MHQIAGNSRLDKLAAVTDKILHTGIDGVQQKIQQAGHHRLSIFLEQKGFQIIIAQRRKFDINFADKPTRTLSFL